MPEILRIAIYEILTLKSRDLCWFIEDLKFYNSIDFPDVKLDYESVRFVINRSVIDGCNFFNRALKSCIIDSCGNWHKRCSKTVHIENIYH